MPYGRPAFDLSSSRTAMALTVQHSNDFISRSAQLNLSEPKNVSAFAQECVGSPVSGPSIAQMGAEANDKSLQ